ncbi:unnamed protein product [Thelazia callipaeda]|uniref:Calponin-homology (CH) domain-containing protein n=1 Tax=Thelazia callipaeda TaxID=103827 RepID=A0A0N5CWD0_THECL|nr:unnamed protein product [Thelazia callipaeda]
MSKIEQQSLDAAWKKIQQNTFTRWVQQKLSQVDEKITDLATDFEEGLKLIRLIEVLSGKKFSRYNKKVAFRHQKLENISLVLRFLEDEEHIKLINIDSSAIADRNLKLILGLVWSLILHYSISKEVSDNQLDEEIVDIQMPAREKLLNWINSKLPAGIVVNNFTSDWNNGILLGALVSSCAPDLKVGWEDWLPSEALQSTITAMKLASDYLGVAALIAPEELISASVDERSIMTYISQFLKAKYTPPLGSLCGVDLMPVIGISSKFMLRTRDPAVVPKVTIKGPDKSSIYCSQLKLSETLYEFRYLPECILAALQDIASGDSAELAKTKISVVRSIDTSSIIIDGFEHAIFGQKQIITIDIKDLKPTNCGLEVFVESERSKYLIPLRWDSNSSVYKGIWIPDEVGRNNITIFFDKQLVREYELLLLCPYDVNEFKAKNSDICRVIVGESASFLFDVKDRNRGIEVQMKGPSETEVDISTDCDDFYTVQCTMQTPGLYEMILFFEDTREQVPDRYVINRSAINIAAPPLKILADYKRDPSKILIKGYNTGHVQIGVPTSIYVDATHTALEPITAWLSSVSVQPVVEEIKPRVYRITFTPLVVENEKITLEIMYGERLLAKPLVFIVDAKKESKFVVLKNCFGGPLPSIIQASFPYTAFIDATNIEENDKVAVEVKGPDNKPRKLTLTKCCDEIGYLLSFLPETAGKYVIILYLNGKQVLDHYELLAQSIGFANLCVVECKFSKGNIFRNRDMADGGNGDLTVRYQPRECGVHSLSVKHNGIDINGSPVEFDVYEALEEYIRAYGPGLLHATVGQPASFTISSKGLSTAEISIAVEGPEKAVIRCHDNKDSTCSVSWTPTIAGEYKIHVRFCAKSVEGSPFTVIATDEDQKRAHLSLYTAQTEILLNITDVQLEDLSASVMSPSGIEKICSIRSVDCDQFGVSFVPREVGEHLIFVKKNDRAVEKSPFRVTIADASKVIVDGSCKCRVICQEDNYLTVNTCDAGHGVLSISIHGPSEAELRCFENKEGVASVVYKLSKPGIYILSILYAGVHVNDSPFTVICDEKTEDFLRESATKEIKLVPEVLPGQDTALYLQLENISPLETTAKVVDPNGCSEDVEIHHLGNSLYRFQFRPLVSGRHAISVFYKGKHISGSPILYTVGQMKETGAHKVLGAGIGLNHVEVNRKQSFNLYTREAGQGNLEVVIEGPSKADLQFHEHEDGNCHFDFRVAKSGEYQISVKFNAEHIPGSPFKVYVVPSAEEPGKLELSSFSDHGVLGKACSFTMKTNGLLGRIEAKLETPSKRIETLDVVQINENGSYVAQFTPDEVGDYYVDLTLDGTHVQHSRLRFRIDADHNDPSIITVSGNGIHGGQAGQDCEFIVNTYDAGTGLLQIQIDGPSKVTMIDCSGPYSSDTHVPGSPFKAVIEGQEMSSNELDSSFIKINTLAKVRKELVEEFPNFCGDAEKVVVEGYGLKKFLPGQPTFFNINSNLAGENVLFVGVMTSKGPCKEITVRHVGHGQFEVQYIVDEEAKSFIFIKYGNDDVPGSPFQASC